MTTTLFLRLQAPMQSYGVRSAWSVRDTAMYPSKSAVIGILGCSLGARSDETLRKISNSIKVGVRADRPGVLSTDYQTLGGQADAHRMGNGKLKTGHVEQIFKDYLADASFLVAVQVDDTELLDNLAYAVQNPAWPYFLGRKAFPPAAPVYAGRGDYPSLEIALRSFAWPAGADGLRASLECSPATTGAVRQRDNVDSLRQRRFFPRYLVETTLFPIPGV